MEVRKLDPSFWDKVPVESNRGFNVQEHLAKFLAQVFPGFVFGFFTKDDLEHRRVMEGYEPISKEYWEAVQPWNDKTAFRHGMHLQDGVIMQDKNYVCARPLEWDKRRRDQVNREENAKFQAARRGKAAVIQDRSPEGVFIGSSIVQTANVIPPEVYKEPDTPDEDLKGIDVFTNAPTGGKLQVTVDLPKQPEAAPAAPAPVVKRKPGRPRKNPAK